MFQVLSSYLWMVAIVLDGTDTESLHHCTKESALGTIVMSKLFRFLMCTAWQEPYHLSTDKAVYWHSIIRKHPRVQKIFIEHLLHFLALLASGPPGFRFQ